ncbi:hypothetical protein [Actinoplanes sp. NPDC049118]|uniref:hypothetical protein n=1 Tax=Actinoplanes sp. NPDC049118 TaxID=3155769 RepID=UPI0033D5B2C3
MRNRITSMLAAAGVVAATSVAVLTAASPAQAAVSWYADLGPAYSYTEAHTEGDPRQSRSYARHGSVSALSGWYTENSWAFADAGTASSWAARADFR